MARLRATFDTIAVKRGRGRGGLFRRAKARTRNVIAGGRDLDTLWRDIDTAVAVGKRVNELIAETGGDVTTRRTWRVMKRHLAALERLGAAR